MALYVWFALNVFLGAWFGVWPSAVIFALLAGIAQTRAAEALKGEARR